MNVLTGYLKNRIKTDANLQTQNLSVSVNGKIGITQVVGGVSDHDKLNNLDYANSGHTGFASEAQVRLLLQKDLSVLPKNNLSNRNSQIYLYDGNAINKETQVTVSDLLNAKIKTVDTVPDDLQRNDYIFLEINNNA